MKDYRNMKRMSISSDSMNCIRELCVFLTQTCDFHPTVNFNEDASKRLHGCQSNVPQFVLRRGPLLV